MYQDNSAVLQTPKASKSKKWKDIVSHLYKQDKYGSGVRTVFLPKCFDQLLDRLDLCAAAYKAGNNGVRNEIVAILGAMKKAKYISRKEYETLHRKLPQQQAHLNNLISGGGIATIHDFVQRYK